MTLVPTPEQELESEVSGLKLKLDLMRIRAEYAEKVLEQVASERDEAIRERDEAQSARDATQAELKLANERLRQLGAFAPENDW